MINIRISGGLGNQIFQLGLAILLGKKYNMPLCLNIRYIKSHATEREFSLSKLFNIDDNLISNNSSLVFKFRIAKIKFAQLLFPFYSDNNVKKIIHKKSIDSDIYIDGYFINSINQTFFDEMIPSLIKIFKFNSNNFNKSFYENKLFVHIRGGDFIKYKYEITNLETYYRKSVDFFTKNYKIDKINIITDDLDYARNIVDKFNTNINVDFISENELSDFLHLKNAIFKVLSNSTFSFWAGALSNSNSIIIAPDEWYPGAPRLNKLKNEIKIEYL